MQFKSDTMEKLLFVTYKIPEIIILPSLVHRELKPVVNEKVIEFITNNKPETIEYLESEHDIAAHWDELEDQAVQKATFITISKLMDAEFKITDYKDQAEHTIETLIRELSENTLMLYLTFTRLYEDCEEIHLSFKYN